MQSRLNLEHGPKTEHSVAWAENYARLIYFPSTGAVIFLGLALLVA